MRLSVIIPTLNAANSLGATLAALTAPPASGAASEIMPESVPEIVVVDGGSIDATRSVAEQGGAVVVEEARGRGQQLAAGAVRAAGDWLLFLHADTVVDTGWHDAVAGFAAVPANRERAGYFRFTLDADSAPAHCLERLVGLRCAVLGLPYGDQGFLVCRALYERIGGYRPYPLMEDVDIVRRVGRRNMRVLDIRAVTSAVRFTNAGYLRRSLRNLFCLGLFFAGVSPERIARIYH